MYKLVRLQIAPQLEGVAQGTCSDPGKLLKSTQYQ